MMSAISMAPPRRVSLLHLRLVDGSISPGTVLQDFCQSITPAWRIGAGGVFLDLTGSERLYGRGPDGVAEVCRRARAVFPVAGAGSGTTELSASLASLVASRSGREGFLWIPPGSVPSFLTLFPVEVIPGQDGTTARLRSLGVRTLGDLQVLPLDLLRALLGDRADALAAAATGRGSGLTTRSGPGLVRWSLLLGARLQKPLASARGVSILLDAMALRALTFYPDGPDAAGGWALGAILPGNVRKQTWTRTGGEATLDAWRHLLGRLWRKLPDSRQGIIGLDFFSGPPRGSVPRQGNLFPASSRSFHLSRALVRLQARGAPPLQRASENLLSAWGITWQDGADRG